MNLEILVEEPSMAEALNILLPRLLAPETVYRVITFRGKGDLLHQLPNRLLGYSAWITDEYRILVLVDEDREDCQVLKWTLEQAALNAGLSTKTNNGGQRFQVLNRIVVEELEAWFFGDIQAICQAFPQVPSKVMQSGKFHNPDAIPNGTWETLEKILQRYGYYKGGYRKIEAARAISAKMDPLHNDSHSYQVFRDGLASLP